MNPRNWIISASAWLIFIALFAFGRPAHSETIAATYSTVKHWANSNNYAVHGSTWSGFGSVNCGGSGIPSFDAGGGASANAYQCTLPAGGYASPHTVLNPSPTAYGSCLGVCGNGSSFGANSINISEYTCPSGGYTLSGQNCVRPDCTANQVRNPTTGACEAPPCTSKASAGSGFFDGGTSPEGGPPGVVCSGGCMAVFSGTFPAGRSMQGGTYHYYGSGNYTFAGGGSSDSCTQSARTPAMEVLAQIPNPTCAPNMIEGQINGVLTCLVVPPTSSPTTPTTQNNPNAAQQSGSTTTTHNTTNNTTTTVEVTNNPGGGVSTKTTTCDAAGNCSGTTTTTPGKNENLMPSVPTGGTLNAAASLATDETRTVASVWATRRAQMAATPLFSLASSLTSFPGMEGASCPAFSIPQGHLFGVQWGGDISPPCWIWPVLRAFLLLTSLFVARRLVFGG